MDKSGRHEAKRARVGELPFFSMGLSTHCVPMSMYATHRAKLVQGLQVRDCRAWNGRSLFSQRFWIVLWYVLSLCAVKNCTLSYTYAHACGGRMIL